MYRSGWLFGILTIIGMAGAGGLMVSQVMRGESVLAQPLAPQVVVYGRQCLGPRYEVLSMRNNQPVQGPAGNAV